MDYAPLFGIVLTVILAAIVWIDFQKLIIPDALNFALAATGIAYQSVVSPELLWVQLAAGIAVLAVFWLIRRIHTAATGRIGLGLGDVKMAGASAIWLSPWNLPAFVFAASISALVLTVGRHFLRKDLSADTRQPFGPFLSAGLLLIWFCEQYFSTFQGL
jgi:leader peptidase (prepilin peptidase) / N-methyltransferase